MSELISGILANIGVVTLIISYGILFLLGLWILVLSISFGLILIGTAIIIDKAYETKEIKSGESEQ